MLYSDLSDVADDVIDILLTDDAELIAVNDAQGNERNTVVMGASIEYMQTVRLHIRMILKGTDGYPDWTHYSFHFMDSDNQTIFRYDNAPHHNELASAPHHKHEGGDETVSECEQPSARTIRGEIESYLETRRAY